jgi:hypothetical protein
MHCHLYTKKAAADSRLPPDWEIGGALPVHAAAVLAALTGLLTALLLARLALTALLLLARLALAALLRVLPRVVLLLLVAPRILLFIRHRYSPVTWGLER